MPAPAAAAPAPGANKDDMILFASIKDVILAFRGLMALDPDQSEECYEEEEEDQEEDQEDEDEE